MCVLTQLGCQVYFSEALDMPNWLVEAQEKEIEETWPMMIFGHIDLVGIEHWKLLDQRIDM